MTVKSKQPTPKQIELLKHTLGLDWQNKAYRNYFVSGGQGDPDLPHLDGLVQMGMMSVRRNELDQMDESYIYIATDAGCKAAGLSGIEAITR